MDKKHKGALAELKACAWLLKQGYEVYRNVSPFGPYDIVAWKNAKFETIDVKTASSYITKKGELRYYHPERAQEDAKLIVYGYETDEFWWEEDYNALVESQSCKPRG